MNDTCTIIRGGRILDPANGRDEIGDLFIKNGILVETLSDVERKQAEIIEAKGSIVCPGLVDIHVHFREPGQTHKENVQTGSWASAAGGFTSVVFMPNTSPACDSAVTLESLRTRTEQGAIVRVYPTGCITLGRKGKSLAPMQALKEAGAVALTDDGDCIQNHELMKRAAEYAAMLDIPLMDHCQDESLTQGAVMNEGIYSLKLGLEGWPREAESIIVHRNIALAQTTGAHMHMQHMTSKDAVELLRQAKKQGIRVTAEVSPHHLSLTEEALSTYNTHFKMNPPLRTEEDREALIEGLLDGTLDIIATDHAPHAADEKELCLDDAPFGIVGLETSLAVCLETLYHKKRCSLSDIIARMTHKPAKLLGLPAGTLSIGAKADIALFNPDESWTVGRNTLFGKSTNSPWLGTSLQGRIQKTLVGGRVVFDGERIFAEKLVSKTCAR